jgi:hypothetical protein
MAFVVDSEGFTRSFLGAEVLYAGECTLAVGHSSIAADWIVDE